MEKTLVKTSRNLTWGSRIWLTWTIKRFRSDDRKIMQVFRMVSGPLVKEKNWNQLSQFR